MCICVSDWESYPKSQRSDQRKCSLCWQSLWEPVSRPSGRRWIGASPEGSLSSGFALAPSFCPMDLCTLPPACLPTPAGQTQLHGVPNKAQAASRLCVSVSESNDSFRVVSTAEPLGPQWHKSFYLHSSPLPRTEQGWPGIAEPNRVTSGHGSF